MTSPPPTGSGSSSARAPGTGQSDHDQVDLADRVAESVLAVPGVVRLHAGAFGEVATYLPGRAVPGVRLRPDETEVHLVVSARHPIPSVARGVHEVVRALVHGPVRVYIEDVEAPPTHRPRPERAST
ncbi:Asp23/Gls24 family envelope stress response protein [Isoptericola sp. 4D.3]|uniref:Asp23/Gls24 family envelope stress response protein n=1 Tax=Isoptericola peretonis TaxID=2918523 RepID=A0ABT0J5I5_9MICO|nr:Asp23/Gls24 family envelope stress response protein [Isoptericola sp. 4D.3]